jgi:hypothetical protein
MRDDVVVRCTFKERLKGVLKPRGPRASAVCGHSRREQQVPCSRLQHDRSRQRRFGILSPRPGHGATAVYAAAKRCVSEGTEMRSGARAGGSNEREDKTYTEGREVARMCWYRN